MTTPRADLDGPIYYPDVYVELRKENAFMTVCRVDKALKQAGVPREMRINYVNQATRHDYEWLLHVTMRWVRTQFADSELEEIDD